MFMTKTCAVPVFLKISLSLNFATFSSSLYLSHIKSTLTRQLCIKVNDYVLEKIKTRMEKEEIFHRLDIGKVKEMMIPVLSILSSKPACQFSSEEMDHLSIIILKVYTRCAKICLLLTTNDKLYTGSSLRIW